MRSPVYKTFDAARAFRVTVPLQSGRYKLEQALWELGRIRSNLDLVAKIVRKQDAKAAKAALVGCAPEGRGIYVKQVPTHVANILGRLILPSIAELTGDGVPKRDVRLLVRQAKKQADTILDDADRVYDRLRAGVSVEYDAMKSLGSFTLPLVDEAERLVSVALDACSPDP